MKILIITNYWKPWNTSGTMRWLQLSKYIDFDVLTSRKPRGGFYDETLPGSSARVYRYGWNLYACLSGCYLACRALLRKYDLYIFTTPPESFIAAAWVFQKLGRRVILDVRDRIDRKNQKLKFMILIYHWFYRKVKEKVVSFQFLDNEAEVVRSGYDENLEKKIQTFVYMPTENRTDYENYLYWISRGFISDYRNKPKGYGSSSFINLLYLGFKNLPRHFHPEIHDQPIISWKESAEQYKKILEGE